MHSLDLLKMAVGSLIRRKTRTLLTILGVIIGTASIVVMLSLGIAMDESLKDSIASMGDLTIIEIYNYGGGMVIGPGGSQQQSPKLDDAAVAKLKQIPNVKGVMPIKRAYMKMGAGRYVGHVSIIGIDPANMEAFDFKTSRGRLLTANDKDVIVYGKNVHYNFYNPRLRNHYYGGMGDEPIVDLMTSKLVMTSDMNYGETRIEIDNQPDKPKPKVYDIKAVGELEESFSEKDYSVYMNITALEKIIEEDRRNNRESNIRDSSNTGDKYESISVKVFDFMQVEEVQEQIKAMGFQTYSLTEILNSMKEQSKITQGVLGGIGAISLLVAAIGITNTMIMSIYERTRDIGIMKVIGADLDDIKKMFLIEAGMIGFWGGALGIAFSYGLSYMLNTVGSSLMGGGMGMGGSKLSIIPVELALAGLVFATLIGLVSGYSPARRAMNISALDAIRND